MLRMFFICAHVLPSVMYFIAGVGSRIILLYIQLNLCRQSCAVVPYRQTNTAEYKVLAMFLLLSFTILEMLAKRRPAMEKGGFVFQALLININFIILIILVVLSFLLNLKWFGHEGR